MSSRTKVIHVSTEAHTNAKAFCKERGMQMASWVERLMREAMERERPLKQLQKAIAKKRYEAVITDENVLDISAPPFWERRAEEAASKSI